MNYSGEMMIKIINIELNKENMATEIERKYLVNKDIWDKVTPEKTVIIKQVYLCTDPDKTVRIRTKGDKGYITIKNNPVGPVRSEYEYEIPFKDANELIGKYSESLVEKHRHIVTFKKMQWEVDEFKGKNSGLIIAEIELVKVGQKFIKPEWIGKEVTKDGRYYNANLSIHPYNITLRMK